jgi:NAD(P)-dependent dehydrogenase (short-subunit alcohol dehydrogenase family)
MGIAHTAAAVGLEGGAQVNDRFRGRNVVVIGGNSGIGLAAAHAFAQEGANVVITGRAPQTDFLVDGGAASF